MPFLSGYCEDNNTHLLYDRLCISSDLIVSLSCLAYVYEHACKEQITNPQIALELGVIYSSYAEKCKKEKNYHILTLTYMQSLFH